MTRPNIIFILCDDLGINDLHCYGREEHTTPNLDRLAREGTRFTSAYACQPICSPSRAGILTGLNPSRLHLTTYLPGRPDCATQRVLHPEITMNLPLEVKSFPKYFGELGYRTGLVGKWHVGGKGYGPLKHGFDHFYSAPANTEPSDTEGGKGEYELTRAALDFVEADPGKPFALYLGHNTPHIPYTAKQHLVRKHDGAFEPVYAALIETLDDTIGLIMKRLGELGKADDTILVFTSDNGGLHVPELNHERVTHNTPFRAGKGYVYEGGNRVPLIIRWPGKIEAGRVVETPVNNIDWIPTLLELAGAPVPAGLDGVSFAAGLRGTGAFPERPIYWHFPHYTNQGGRPTGAMRDGEWLLVEYYDAETVELYDLGTDVGEQRDLAADHPERVRGMRAALDAWRRENEVQYNTPNPEYDEDRFAELYTEFDPSRFDPPNASRDEWAEIQLWPISLKKIRYEPFKGRVLFHTKYSEYFKENVHMFDALDFLAELTQHIPPKGTQLIRRYGLYSSRIKGRWEEMDYIAERAPEGWRGEHERFVDPDQEPVGFSPRGVQPIVRLRGSRFNRSQVRLGTVAGACLRGGSIRLSGVRVPDEGNRGHPGP